MSDAQPKEGKPPEQGAPKDDANRPEGASPKVDGLPLGEAEVQRVTLPPEMPVLPVRGMVLFPQVVLPIAVNEERDLRLVNNVVVGNRLMVVVAVKNEKAEHPGPDDLYQVGCAVAVLKMMKFPDETTRILVQGLSRVRLDRITSTSPYLKAGVSRLESVLDDNIQTRALARSVIEQFQKLVDLSPHLPDELKLAILNIDDVSRLANVVSTTLNLTVAQRQESLETLNVAERLRKVNVHLSRELQTAELSTKITSQVKTEFDKDQREFILRRQLKAIQEELGETDEGAAEWDELRKRIQKLRLPEEAKKEAQRELDRLKKMPPQASEYHVARTYLDWIISLPWHKSTTDRLDIARGGGDPERGPLRPRPGQAAHPRIPGGAQAEEGHARADPLLRRAAGHRQDLARALHRARARPEIRAHLPRRRPRRGRDPRPPPHLRRRAARAHHPGNPQGRIQQPRLHARRD